MAADEGGRVRERHVEFSRHRALLLRGSDEGVQVVADHLRHAGGRDGDHLRRVKRVGVREAVDHVVEAAEHRGVLGHRRRHRRGGLLEMAREVRTIVGDAALRAVHEGQRAFEAGCGEHRPERLAGLRRIDHQRFAREVLLAILPALAVFDLRLDVGRRRRTFEVFALAFEQLLVFRLAEQGRMIENAVGRLWHGQLRPCLRGRPLRRRVQSSSGARLSAFGASRGEKGKGLQAARGAARVPGSRGSLIRRLPAAARPSPSMADRTFPRPGC